MEEHYCVLCQDGHKMSELCVTNNVQCKGCGNKGHVRRDCPEELQLNVKRKFSMEQRKQIIQECVEGNISPSMLGKKWKCNPDTIRTWVRMARMQMPKKYNKVNYNYNYQPESPSTSDTDDGDIADSVGQDKDDSIASRLRKRKGSSQDSFSCFANRDSISGIASKHGIKRKMSNPCSDLPYKSLKLMPDTDYKSDQSGKAVIFQPAQSEIKQAAGQQALPSTRTPQLLLPEVPVEEANVDSSIICLDTTEEDSVTNETADSDNNGNVICISDSDENEDPESISCNESTMLMDYSLMMDHEQDFSGPTRLECQNEEYYESKEIVKTSDVLNLEGPIKEYYESKENLKCSDGPKLEGQSEEYYENKESLKSSDGPRLEGQIKEYYENKEILKSPDKPRLKGQMVEYYESKEILKTSVQVLNHQDKSPNLKAGAYNILSVHLELFRSSKSSITKLTQIGCVVSGWSSGVFFKAIKPDGIEEYLDHYKLGGDLLQALHMTREDDGTFLFRSRFEVIEEAEKIICSEETEALTSLLDFLQDYPNCIIVGVDEDTLAILVGKLKNVGVEKFQSISAFTYWKRLLKYLDVDGYKSIDLEEYYTNMVGEDLPSFTTALDIASVVMRSVKEVASKEKGGRKSVDSDFYKLCKRIECIQHPIKFDYNIIANTENVEVYSSFRPSVSATISAEKLEQIILSESESEPEETEECQAGVEGFVAATDDAGGSNPSVQPLRFHPLRVQPSTFQPSTFQTSTFQPSTFQPSTFQPSTFQPSTVPSSMVQPSRIQPFKQHPFRLQPSTVQPPTLQPSRLQPSIDQPSTVQPSRVQPSRHQSTTVRPSVVQPSRLRPVWVLGDPTPNEGTVLCPKCLARVKYSNISSHISKVHPNMQIAGAGRLCPVCQKNIFLFEVANHMPLCSPGPAPAQPTQQSLRGTKPAGSNSVRTAEPPVTTSDRPRYEPLPSPCCVVLRIVLDSYLVKNFELFPAGIVKCLWMYKDYQKTMMAQNHREVLSYDKFVVEVAEGAMMNWNINVRPSGSDKINLLMRMDPSHLYFQGFRKKCND